MQRMKLEFIFKQVTPSGFSPDFRPVIFLTIQEYFHSQTIFLYFGKAYLIRYTVTKIDFEQGS